MSLITSKMPQPIHVEELDTNEEMRREIQSLARSWEILSIEKLRLATSDLERKSYDAARIVNLVTFQRTSRIANFTCNFSSVICYGIDLNIRGFALIRPITLPIGKSDAMSPEHSQRFLHLNYLSTGPNNLFNKTEWKGIGSSLIYFLFEKCIREEFAGIFVEPLPSAESFFEHFEFSLSDTTGSTKRAMLWQCPKTETRPSYQKF